MFIFGKKGLLYIWLVINLLQFFFLLGCDPVWGHQKYLVIDWKILLFFNIIIIIMTFNYYYFDY